MDGEPDVAQRPHEEVPQHPVLELAVDPGGAEHVLAPAQAQCGERALSGQPAAAVDAPPAVERAREQDAIDPAFEDRRHAEPKHGARETDDVGGEHELNFGADVRRERSGFEPVALFDSVNEMVAVAARTKVGR